MPAYAEQQTGEPDGIRAEVAAGPVADTGTEGKNNDNEKKLSGHMEILFVLRDRVTFQCVYTPFDVSRAGGTHVIIIIQFGETMDLQTTGKGDEDVCQVV